MGVTFNSRRIVACGRFVSLELFVGALSEGFLSAGSDEFVGALDGAVDVEVEEPVDGAVEEPVDGSEVVDGAAGVCGGGDSGTV